MPKLKTKSSAKKRFRFTASGKIKMPQAGKRHGMIKRTNSQIRKQRGTTIFESCFVIIVVPLCFLICEFVRLIIPCLLPAWAIITLPFADILNLFFAELLVLSFGIIERGYTKNDENLQPILKPIKAELP